MGLMPHDTLDWRSVVQRVVVVLVAPALYDNRVTIIADGPNVDADSGRREGDANIYSRTLPSRQL